MAENRTPLGTLSTDDRSVWRTGNSDWTVELRRSKSLRIGSSPSSKVVGGDFFNGVPGGADAYLLKSVLHDWDDEQAARILTNCRAAMVPGAKLLAVEPVIRMNEPDPENLFTDLRMLVMNGGRDGPSPTSRSSFAAAAFRFSTAAEPSHQEWLGIPAGSPCYSASYVGWGQSLVGYGSTREAALADLAHASNIPTAECVIRELVDS